MGSYADPKNRGPRKSSGIVVFFLCCVLFLSFACGGKKKGAQTTAEKPGTSDMEVSSKNQVRELKIQELETSTEISIDGSLEPDFTVFKLDEPLRVVIDVANTELGDIAGPFGLNNGTINEVTTTQFDDASTSIARFIIGFDQIVDYTVDSEGTRLKINIQRIGAPPEDFQEILVRGEVPPASAESPGDLAEAPASEAGEEFEEGGLTEKEEESDVSAPKMPASQIIDVQFDSSDPDMLTLSFFADGKIENFNAFNVEKPNRIVVDFPGLSSSYAKNKITAPAPLKTVRFGAHSDKLRIVLDSRGGKELPKYSTEIVGDRLVLKLGGGSALDVAEAPGDEDFSGEQVAADASMDGPVEKIGGLDFKQLPKYSRVVVKIPESVAYETLPFEDGKVKIDLFGVRLPSTLRRSLDTSEFDSPITLISAYGLKGKEGVVRLEFGLREDVPLVVLREADLINFDFERSRVFVEAPTATDTQTVALGADSEPSAALEPAEIPMETGPGEEPLEEGPDAIASEPAPGGEEVLLAEETGPTDEKLPELLDTPVAGGGGKGQLPVETTVISSSGVQTGGSAGLANASSGDIFGASPLGLSGEGGQQFTGRRISLDFKDADIQNIFRLIAEVSKLNIIVGESVSGKVTMRLINVPWDQALAIVLQTKKLGIIRYDNILRIAPLSELEQERIEQTNLDIAKRNAKPLDVMVLPVNYTQAGDLQSKIQSLLTQRGRITVDERTNTLIIEDIKEILFKAQNLVKTLDTATAQVVIDGRIVSANKSWQRSLGIQWGGHYQAAPASGNPTGLAFPATIGVGGGSAATPGTVDPLPTFPGFGSPNFAVNLPSEGGENGTLGISLGTLTGIGNLDARLAALENESKARVISSPRVATLDNISATINQGARIPFRTVSSAGTQTIFVDATLSLTVTPHVTNDRSVFMELTLTNNSIGDNTDAGPAINIAETQTQVLVKDGDTMVLGGLYVLETSKSNQGLPWLRSVPGVNLLFSNYNKIDSRRELLFFITPRVVDQAFAAR